MYVLLLLLLIFVPILAYRVACRRHPRHVFFITGVAFGAIVAPFTLGLYVLYFASPFTAVIGIIGLPLALIHGSPGFTVAVYLGLIPKGEVVSGLIAHAIMEAFNAATWAFCYGLLGYVIDYFRNRKRRRSC